MIAICDDNNRVIGCINITPNSIELSKVEDYQNAHIINEPFIEDFDLYEYNETSFQLISGWEDIKTQREITKTIQDFDELKKQKINSITLDAKAPVTINGVIFNGGGSSASAISGAVTLATALVETDVKLWDIDNVIHTYTFDEANAIAAQIAQTYRDIQLQKYALIEQINAVVIDGTINVTIADAIAELDAIVI